MRHSFSHKIHVSLRDELEELFFFNPRQSLFRSGIESALEKWGIPEIIQKSNVIVLSLPKLRDAQCLFTITDGPHVVAAAIFHRPCFQVFQINHLAVVDGRWHDDLTVENIVKLTTIASQLNGVSTILFPYCFKSLKWQPRSDFPPNQTKKLL